jgi:hypothetical protein
MEINEGASRVASAYKTPCKINTGIVSTSLFQEWGRERGDKGETWRE